MTYPIIGDVELIWVLKTGHWGHHKRNTSNINFHSDSYKEDKKLKNITKALKAIPSTRTVLVESIFHIRLSMILTLAGDPTGDVAPFRPHKLTLIAMPPQLSRAHCGNIYKQKRTIIQTNNKWLDIHISYVCTFEWLGALLYENVMVYSTRVETRRHNAHGHWTTKTLF